MQLHVLEPLFKIIHTLSEKIFSSCRLKFAGKNCRQIYGKSKARVWRNLGTISLRCPKFVSKILCCVALVYNSYFFQNSRFTEIIRYWILIQTL